MTLFGWKSQHLVMLYFVDTFVSFACLFILFYLNGGDASASPGTWPNVATPPRYRREDIPKLLFVVVMFGVVFGFALGFPVFLQVRGGDELRDPGFLAGAAIQMMAAAHVFVVTDRDLRGRKPAAARSIVRRRMAFVALRWIVLFAVALILPFAPAMVLAYVAASVYLELRPPPLE
ncbi:MAG: hypothetical protein H7Y14_13370 [Burkholderiales bacterium]|nr:hypothetical protein [Burkholderiales bacterium]